MSYCPHCEHCRENDGLIEEEEFDDFDYEEAAEREQERLVEDCRCGAYQFVGGKFRHIADCVC